MNALVDSVSMVLSVFIYVFLCVSSEALYAFGIYDGKLVRFYNKYAMI